MAAGLIPPIQTPMIDPKTGLVTTQWALYFQGLSAALKKVQP